MSQDPDPHGQRPADGPPPSLYKGSDGPGQPAYPQAPAGPYPPAASPSAPGPVGYGPGYGGAPRKPKNGLGVAALVLGILSIPAGFLAAPIGVVLGLIAIILGAVGMSRAKKGLATNRGIAIAGLVTGIVGAIIGAVFTYVAFRAASDCLSELGEGASQGEINQCVADKLGG